MEKKKRRKPWWKVILTIIGILIGLYVLLFVTNWGFSMALRAYIGSFAPVHYDAADRIVPEYDEELGHYTITTDRDLKVMMLTDIYHTFF